MSYANSRVAVVCDLCVMEGKEKGPTVMAMLGGTDRPENSDTSATACAAPLLGPSLGTAPDGQCTWMLRCLIMSSTGSCVRPSSNACALTHDSATSTLSLSTSPSLPVSCTRPLPGMSATSMNRMLPLPPELSSTVSCGRYASRLLLSLASAYSTALARHTDPSSRSKLRTPASRVYDSITLATTVSSSPTCASRRVAGQVDHLHAVQQRRRNGVQAVGRRNEQHAAEVVRHRQVVVLERVILFRVQHLEHRRGRVAVVAGRPDLVNLVQQDHRVGHAHLAQALHNQARHRRHVCAPVATDFRFVADAAQRDPVELAAQRRRHRPRQARLAHARRAHKQQDGRPVRHATCAERLQLLVGRLHLGPGGGRLGLLFLLHVRAGIGRGLGAGVVGRRRGRRLGQLQRALGIARLRLDVLVDRLLEAQHRHVLEQPLLDLLEAVVVTVELRARLGQRARAQPVVRHLRPRDLGQRLQVAANDAVLCLRRHHLAQPLELTVGNLGSVRRQLRRLKLLGQLLDLVWLLLVGALRAAGTATESVSAAEAAAAAATSHTRAKYAATIAQSVGRDQNVERHALAVLRLRQALLQRIPDAGAAATVVVVVVVTVSIRIDRHCRDLDVVADAAYLPLQQLHHTRHARLDVDVRQHLQFLVVRRHHDVGHEVGQHAGLGNRLVQDVRVQAPRQQRREPRMRPVRRNDGGHTQHLCQLARRRLEPLEPFVQRGIANVDFVGAQRHFALEARLLLREPVDDDARAAFDVQRKLSGRTAFNLADLGHYTVAEKVGLGRLAGHKAGHFRSTNTVVVFAVQQPLAARANQRRGDGNAHHRHLVDSPSGAVVFGRVRCRSTGVHVRQQSRNVRTIGCGRNSLQDAGEQDHALGQGQDGEGRTLASRHLGEMGVG
ncbi:hypothetical protein SPBR_00171 [Sporothrix brasiliensis 5110]|uniref:Uncharacterized protein n=1 Tax=Sporothrix brasiliensis 5110 TaxID=1398154 RepID=A0A0C2EUC5_9PEZI|nr:uncharacterized protein SPBR_00171 [Sporothrix brasiliensis 5110]KIH90129.1 hypothetical protein SPBR_00171 [Sporothrix brasiliensis 5110]